MGSDSPPSLLGGTRERLPAPGFARWNKVPSRDIVSTSGSTDFVGSRTALQYHGDVVQLNGSGCRLSSF